MMSVNFSLGFEVYPKRHIQDSARLREVRREIPQSQNQVLRSLIRLGSNLTVSLRYFYYPNQSPPLKTYLLINQAADSQTAENSEQISSLLTKGKLSEFFTLIPQAQFGNLQKLEWVQFIGEVLKHEEFIEPQNYYLPHFFEANPANDMSAVYDVLNNLKNRLIVEITLQTYHYSDEKPCWVNTINQMIAQLDNKINSGASGSKDNRLSATLALYQKYEQLYPTGDLVKYSIKALAANRGDARVVLDTLVEHATKETAHGKPGKILIVSRGNPGFSESLQATEKVDISTAIEWEGWQRNFGQLLIRDAIKPKKTGLAKFSDGSMSLSNLSSAPRLPGSAENPNQPRENDIVLSGSSALAKFLSSPPPARIADLKPLHRLATTQEISGFFRIAIPRDISVQNMTPTSFPVANAEELFNYYKKLLDSEPDTYRDSYIVGIDDEGNPVTSSWAEIPHRLVAGVPGAGKSNFLNWVIFQFLCANPNGKIYIADFAGVDFNFLLTRLQANVKIVTTPEECQQLVEELHSQEYQRRMDLLRQYEVQNIKQLQEEEVDIQRTLFIVDEAADIALASSKLRDTIEKRLIEYARKGRKCGLHVIYCTQRPSVSIITPQVLESCEEKIVFRVSGEASQAIIETSQAGTIPKQARGRAVLKGSGGDNIFVNTPYIQVPIGSKVQVTDTLWRNLVTQS